VAKDGKTSRDKYFSVWRSDQVVPQPRKESLGLLTLWFTYRCFEKKNHKVTERA